MVIWQSRQVKTWKVQGLIGHASAVKKTDANNISESEIGIGATSTWKMASLSPYHSYAIFFEIANTGG
ncbi:AFH_G0023200.mRNA.1.CDS.1 [Saccharomyces cerevisiae]|nr:AFH_G0023200.mRNA.1.CDS.1 [Saccharomyces cerevisiae]CAI6725565.1 AFH_G0023200.mRNA.1.CDS.1 [Saccharomyces cerevisiae]